MSSSRFFSEKDLAAIEAAVKEAELRTSGEIVPAFVNRCRSYPEAALRAGLFTGLLTAWAVGWWASGTWDQLWFHPWEIFIAGFAVGAFSAILTRWWPAWLRFWAGKAAMEQAAWRTARDFFIDEEVFLTRDRTGIVLLVANHERQVVVLADKGINQATTPETWTTVVRDMVQQLKKGSASDALLIGIHDCARILEEKGVEIKPDDKNELPNKLRLRED